ncbi:MAG TPA: NAD(P)-dependent oxidoreductase [Pyrinomonadaceae bacterium]|nr:NAD(P)-dependent oxidoreductase [Pyrinomonadaceae bacterium]
MRCLVTGASGHLGSYLTKLLVREGAAVTALVRPQSDLWRLDGVLDQIRVLRADLSDIESAAPEINRVKPGAVFHLAWQGVTSAFKDTPEQMTLNVMGSLKLFEIVRSGGGCNLWVGLGSQAEYGPHDAALTEETPTRPLTAYGVGKLCAGLLTKKLCELEGVRYVWLRLLATYGPHDDERHLIPSVISKLLAGERPSLTLAEQIWDYLYVEDAAEAIYSLAVAPNAQGVFNLGSGQNVSVREVLERVRDLIDPALPLGFGEIPYPTGQTMRLETSIERLREATGWEPRVQLEEGLRRTIEWHRERRSRFL